MANTTRVCGLRPLNPVIRANVYKHVTGVPVYMYSPATLNAGGYAEIAVTDGTTAGEALLGSVVGFLLGDWSPETSTYSGYLPANPSSTDSSGYVNVLVADSPDQLFLIEETTDGTALTQAAVGLGATMMHYTATSGNAMSGVSTVCIAQKSANTAPSSNLNIQLVKLWDKPDNAYGNYAKWVVRILDHQYQRSAGGRLIEDKAETV